jgi:hypothetical protein
MRSQREQLEREIREELDKKEVEGTVVATNE